ncbi:MAG: adenylate/guanylate cyclase domain-containing protein [Rhodoferax sp.]
MKALRGARVRGVAVALAVLSLAAVWLLSQTRPWHALDGKAFDLITSLAAPRVADPDMVILAIDEPTFAELGQQWPFPRSLHARLLQRLQEDGARAVGFDVVFAESSTASEDAALAAAIAAGPPVVLAALREKTESSQSTVWSEVLPLPQLRQAGADVGQVQVTPDDDFVVRRVPAGTDGWAQRLLARAGWTAAEGASDAGWIAYAGPRGTFDTRSYYQALEPGLLPAGYFRDKVVLVGRAVRTDAELSGSHADMFNSPFSVADGGDRLIPGVEIQANLMANLRAGAGLRAASPWGVVWSVLGLCGLLAFVGARWHPAWAAALALVGAGSAWPISYGLYMQGWWLAPVAPMAAVAAFYVTQVLWAYLEHRHRALAVRRMFAQYVPPAVVEALVARPESLHLGGERRELTILFTDLANFTAMSEGQTPEQTVAVLTEYFGVMTPIIHRHGGTVDKFIGDAIMAFWGAPLADDAHAEHAVRAAMDMQVAMDALVRELTARGLPPIAMRVGVHTGTAVVGNVGSSNRFSYTVIGDAVNLAARLEGANKAFGTGILLSEATACQLPASVGLRHLDNVVVKGKSQAVKVFTPDDRADIRAASALLVERFYAGQHTQALAAAKEVLALLPQDKPAQRFVERLQAQEPYAQALSLDKL